MAASGSLCVMAAHPFLLHAAAASALCRLHSKINSSSKNGALITFQQAARTSRWSPERTARTHAVSKCSPRCCSPSSLLLLLFVLLLLGILFHFISFYLPHAVLKQPMKFVAGCVLKVSCWLSTKQEPKTQQTCVLVSMCVCRDCRMWQLQSKFNVL